jgi:hypothetical protein
MFLISFLSFIILISMTVDAGASLMGSTGPSINGVQVFPSDNIWNVPVDQLPVDPHSDDYVAKIGMDNYLHADFGSGTWDGYTIGIPYNIVSGPVVKQNVVFYYPDESDGGPYPIPADPLIEGGSDHHLLVLYTDENMLYELYDAEKQPDGSWHAGSGAIYDLTGYALRPAGWTSADAAGLPILPGLVRYDEVNAGEITHAIRFTAPSTRKAYIWPARHYASDITDPEYPPMGERFRLKASFDTSGYPYQARIVLEALKKYGMILADNGAPWYISGSPDENWDNDALHLLHQLKGSDFEAVDTGSLMISFDSGQARNTTDQLHTKIGIFRPSTHIFYLDSNGNGVWNGALLDYQYNFGLTGDLPISGDWDNDGFTEIGGFRPTTHIFYLDYNGNGKWDGAVTDRQFNFGLTSDIPVSGDWDNDGFTEIGVFRPSTHIFYLDYNGNGKWDGAVTDRQFNFGLTSDIPVSGDWDNDGFTEIGVFRPSTHIFYLDYNGNGKWDGAVEDRAYNFGLTGDNPVTGKW